MGKAVKKNCWECAFGITHKNFNLGVCLVRNILLWKQKRFCRTYEDWSSKK